MSARSENDGPPASLDTKQVLTAMKNLTVHSKQGTVSLNDLVYHFVNADSKRRNRADAIALEDQKAFQAKIVDLLRQGTGEGACYMVKPNIYQFGAEPRNESVVDKNFRSGAGPPKAGDLDTILEAHLHAQKKKAKLCEQTKSTITKDENQTINSIASIASIESQDAEKSINATKKKVVRRMNCTSRDKGRGSTDEENKTNEPKRAKNRKILYKVEETVETKKLNRPKGRPRKASAVRRPMRMVAENLGGDQANPDEVTGTVARKPRVRRVKTTPVKRAARRASVSKVEVGTEMHFLPSKISIPIPISDLDLEIFTRAQSFQLLSEIFAREARRETKRVNRHGKKMAVLPLGKDDGDLVRDGTPAENGDCPGKMILNENPELNSMSREEGTAV